MADMRDDLTSRKGSSSEMASASATSVVQPYLDSSEKLLWAGRPAQGFALHQFGTLQVVFLLFGFAFTFFWFSMAFSAGAPTFFLLFGALVPTIWLFQMLYPSWQDTRKRKTSVYAITTKRSLIVTDERNQKVRWQDHKTMPEIEFSNHSDGTGSVVFGSSPSNPWNATFAGFGAGRDDRFAFRKIADPQSVLSILREQT